MTAYPFFKAPPYVDFLTELTTKHGVKIEKLETADGETTAYLLRIVDGKPYFYPLTFAAENEIVQYAVIRSVITALKLDPIPFGLHLDPSLGLESS